MHNILDHVNEERHLKKLAIASALSSICKREAVYLVKSITICSNGHNMTSFIPRTQKLTVIVIQTALVL